MDNTVIHFNHVLVLTKEQFTIKPKNFLNITINKTSVMRKTFVIITFNSPVYIPDHIVCSNLSTLFAYVPV